MMPNGIDYTGLNLWLTKNIFASLSEIISGWLDYFSSVINNGFMLTTYINDTEQVRTAVNFTVALAYVLLVAVTVKQIIDIYGFHTSGDANESPIEVIYRASISSVLIAASELFYKQFFHFTKNVARDIGEVTSSKTISNQLDSVLGIQNVVAGTCMVVIMLIAIIIFFLIAAVRGAQLMLFRILFPIFSVDRSLTNKERWNKFLQSYVACFIGFTIQLLCFNMFRLSIMDFGTEVANVSTIASFGWLIMAIKSPKWLDQYVFKSGVGEGLSRSISQAGSILMTRAM